MILDKLLEESTIEFSRSLSLEETNELLDYITKILPAKIDTKTEVCSIKYYDKKSKSFQKKLGTVNISGTIRDDNNYNFDSFTTKNSHINTSKISGICFQIIPGYELEEHRLEVRQLWRDVRKQVDNYFSEKGI